MNPVSSGTGHWNWTGSWEKNIDMIFEENREQAKRVNQREEGRGKGKERSGGGGYLRTKYDVSETPHQHLIGVSKSNKKMTLV